METLDVQGKTETAFKRIFQPYMAADLSAFQLVWRFFTGAAKPRRISITCPTCQTALRDENSSPIQWAVDVFIEVVTNSKDDGKEHDDALAFVAEIVYGGAATCAKLNAAMEADGFNALLWEGDVSRTSTKEGTEQKTVISGKLEMQAWRS